MVDIVGKITGADICHACKKEVNRLVGAIKSAPNMLRFFSSLKYKEQEIYIGLLKKAYWKVTLQECKGHIIFREYNGQIIDMNVYCHE